MIAIIDQEMVIGEVRLPLPKLARDVVVHAWAVPVTYRETGYFVSMQMPGQPMELPACAAIDATYMGSLPMEADAETARAAALDDLKAVSCARIDAECAKRRAAGVLVNFPDGQGIVQTRCDLDLINVTGVASAGLAATVAGTMPDLYFRDEANVNHPLLPTQAVDFGAQVMSALNAITKAAHDAKDAITATIDAAGIGAAEAGVDWPSS